MSEIALSFCFNGRNDKYGHGFLRRFEQAMNFLAYGAEKIGAADRIEVLFADWNVVSPMAEAVKLSPAAANLVRFIEVPPEVAEKHNYGATPFHTTKSMNVAMRRARGAFIAHGPSDILLTPYSLRALIALLTEISDLGFDREKSVMGIPRRFIPFYCLEQDYFNDPFDIERILTVNSDYMRRDETPRGQCGGYGLVLLSRWLTNALRGVDEAIGGWGGSDVDLGARASLYGPIVNLSGFGIDCYDFAPNIKTIREKVRRVTKMPSRMSYLSANAPTWGFEGENFKIVRAKPSADAWRRGERKRVELRALMSSEFRVKLLARSRFVDLKYLSEIAPEAIAIANLGHQLVPKSVLVVDGLDASIAISLSLFSPMARLWVFSSGEGNYAYFSLLGGALRKTEHVGEVRFFPLPFDKAAATLDENDVDTFPTFDLAYLDASLGNGELPSGAQRVTAGVVVIKSGRDSAAVKRTADRAREYWPTKTIWEIVDFGIVIAMDVQSVESALPPDPRALRRAWTPFRGNLLAKAFSRVGANWSRNVKIARIFARADMRSLWRLAFYRGAS